MTLPDSPYPEIARALPRPSVAQAVRFARFVSDAHSWYKHLPVHPGVPFVFFLDPGAGMNRVHTRTGETALVEITDERTRFHYTWQLTRDYRRRFGHWNYHAPGGSTFLYAGEGGVITTAGAGLRVLTESGEWAALPEQLAAAGTVLVSALVHPHRAPGIWASDLERFGLEAGFDPATSADVSPDVSSFDLMASRLWGLLEKPRAARPDFAEGGGLVTPAAAVLLRQIAAGGYDTAPCPPRGDSWDWPGEVDLERLRSAGIDPEALPHAALYLEACLAAESNRQRGQNDPSGQLAAELTEQPGRTWADVTAALIEERARQLADVTVAMGRFLSALG